MVLSPNAADYQQIVAEFRQVTDYRWRSSDRCCMKVRYGVPECCYQIIDGAELTFTPSEVTILDEICHARSMLYDRPSDGMAVLRRDAYDDRMFLEKDLNDGWLADTLECASHPTRPVIGPGGQVMGVVALRDACNSGLGMGEWRREREYLRHLWQSAVDLTGLKPYYVSQRFRDDMMLI